MKSNGFTLIELLGVIAILALLTLLVFPNIIDSIRQSSEKTDDVMLNMIYNAADLYVSNHQGSFPKENGNKYSVTLSDLVSEGALSRPVKLSSNDTDITDTKCVQVLYENGYKYEIKNIGECVKYAPYKSKL